MIRESSFRLRIICVIAVIGSTGCQATRNLFSTPSFTPASNLAGVVDVPDGSVSTAGPQQQSLSVAANSGPVSDRSAGQNNQELIPHLPQQDEALNMSGQYESPAYSLGGSVSSGYGNPSKSASSGCGCSSCSH